MAIIRTASDLGLVIRQRRKQQNLTQGALAKRVGVSRQWIVSIEQGGNRTELGRILRVLNTLGLVVQVEPQPEDPLFDMLFGRDS